MWAIEYNTTLWLVTKPKKKIPGEEQFKYINNFKSTHTHKNISVCIIYDKSIYLTKFFVCIVFSHIAKKIIIQDIFFHKVL